MILLTGAVLNKSIGSLLCFAQFMERDRDSMKEPKQNWVENGNAFNYTNKEKCHSKQNYEHCCWPR